MLNGLTQLNYIMENRTVSVSQVLLKFKNFCAQELAKWFSGEGGSALCANLAATPGFPGPLCR